MTSERRFPPSVLAAVLAVVVYLPSLAGGFLYDDGRVIVENLAIRDLRAVGAVLRSEPSRPVLNLTWALNYAWAGLTPWPYHFVNVGLHGINAALVTSLFLWMSRRRGLAEPERIALTAGALFAVTPMAAETVAYVASRSTALASLFAFAALRFAVAAWTEDPRRRRRAALASLTGYGLALGTKEEAAAVPLLLILLDVFFAGGSWRAVVRERWRFHAPYLLLPVAGLVARRLVTGAWLPEPALPVERYLATQLAVFPQYLVRTLVPLDPAFYRGHPAADWPPEAWTLAGWLLTVGAAASAVAWRRTAPDWSFAVAWLAAGLLPSSSVVALKEMVVDHRAYLGGAGLLFLLGRGVARRPVLAALVVLLLAGRALHYQWVLGDNVRAWADAVARAPRSAEAHRALGEAYASRGDPRAESSLRQAVSLAPHDVAGWTNLGAYYLAAQRHPEAAAAMKKAAEVAPGDAKVRDNLGMVLAALGDDVGAEREFRAAIAATPPLAQPRINLAALLARRGNLAGAWRLLDEAARYVRDPAEDDYLVEVMQSLPERPR